VDKRARRRAERDALRDAFAHSAWTALRAAHMPTGADTKIFFFKQKIQNAWAVLARSRKAAK
jgi:hypothetical protein